MAAALYCIISIALGAALRKRAYTAPLHRIHLHSTLDYPKASDTLYDQAVEVLPTGQLRTTVPAPATELAQTHCVVHETQLAKLRTHQREVRARNADADNGAAYVGAERHTSRARRSWQVDVNGVIPLTNLRDSQYVGPIGVGTKHDRAAESAINVVFDTGSTNLWIASSLCTSEDCKSRAQYNPAKSTTTQTAYPVHLDITFGTGELRGPQAVDDFHVGPYTVKAQTFAMIQEEIGDVFREISFEGILGLAFPSMSARQVTPFFDNVMNQNVLHGRNEFSFYMTKLPSQNSAIFFGGVDERYFEGDIVYFPVTKEHYWSVDIIDFRIGNTSHVNFLEFKSSSAANPRVSKLILDSGTTYFTAPPSLFQKVLDRLPSALCANVQHYPDLHYVLKDVDGNVHDIAVPPSVYMVSSVGDDWCETAFMEIPVPDEYGPAFIFGEVFMRDWYTVFNRGAPGETPTIGFAKARHDNVPQRPV